MGQNLFSVTFLTLFLFIVVDWFSRWYARFLVKWALYDLLKISLQRLLWVLLAVTFWMALIKRAMPEEFNITHFLFALFIFSLFRFLRSFDQPRPEQ